MALAKSRPRSTYWYKGGLGRHRPYEKRKLDMLTIGDMLAKIDAQKWRPPATNPKYKVGQWLYRGAGTTPAQVVRVMRLRYTPLVTKNYYILRVDKKLTAPIPQAELLPFTQKRQQARRNSYRPSLGGGHHVRLGR